MMINLFKGSLRYAKKRWGEFRMRLYLERRIRTQTPVTVERFDFDATRMFILRFLDSLRVPGKEDYLYRYSLSCSTPTLYSSAYACMTRSMLGALADLDPKAKSAWVAYFDSFQDQRDGLFYDPVVLNEIYSETDWWGARHLALHMISAYTDLNARPRHPFRFLYPYYDTGYLQSWLDQYDWHSAAIGRGDPDNRIMNIGCLLQYQRDAWDDEAAGAAVESLKMILRAKINPATGMWGGFDGFDKNQRSRMVQFAYHLFPIFFYDRDFDFDIDQIVRIVLMTQNRYGGYGVELNSSACEDIDSIDILVRLFAVASEENQQRIVAQLEKAFPWIMTNQMPDGGFVFRLNAPFMYGSQATSSMADEGAALPTWFRTLCVLYLVFFFQRQHNFVITRCPGYEY